MERHNIVSRCQTGKLQVSREKQLYIEKSVAFHLGQVCRDFAFGDLDEECVENMDETHFVINMDNGRTLGFKGDGDVKYADVVSGGEKMTMVVRISGGPRSIVETPMMIFCNNNRSYPMRGLPDDVPGVSYRTGPKGWMDGLVFAQWLGNRRAISRDLQGRKRVIFLDHCSGHNITPESMSHLERLNATLRFLPANATDLCQPADSFVISKIKEEWTRLWDLKKMTLKRDSQWQSTRRADGSWSGKLQNPGKRFFLNLAAESVRNVNNMSDKNGLTYARKAMIRCGLAKDVSGVWHEKQLMPHLQEIIRKHRSHFNGSPVEDTSV